MLEIVVVMMVRWEVKLMYYVACGSAGMFPPVSAVGSMGGKG